MLNHLANKLHDAVFFRYQFIVSCSMVMFFIYIGLWTTDIQYIQGNSYDEPAWLRKSVRFEATFSSKYQELFDINYSNLDQLNTSAYLIGLARQISGIPPEAVERYRYNEPIENSIREAVVKFNTVLSSFSIILLAFWIQRSYGYIASVATVSMLTLTPFWTIYLRIIMAEPYLFFFTVLAFSNTLWLTQLLLTSHPHSTLLIASVSTMVGIWTGLAIGVKLNGLVLFTGLFLVLIILGRLQDRILLIWLFSIAFLAAIISFILTNPFLWHIDMLDRFFMIVKLRSTLVDFESIVKADTVIPDMGSALRIILFNHLFQQGHFNILPTLISIPLFVLGLWWGFVQDNYLSRASSLWFVSVGLINIFIVPLDRDRYFIFSILAVHVFIAIGISYLALMTQESVFRKINKPFKHPEPSIYQYPGINSFSSTILIAITACIALIIGLRLYNFSMELAIWKKLPFVNDSVEEIDIVNQIMMLNPQSKWWDQGEPTINWLQRAFEEHHNTLNPDMMRAIYISGQLIQKHSTNKDIQERITYDMQYIGQRTKLAYADNTQICQGSAGTSLAVTATNSITLETFGNGDIILHSKFITATLAISINRIANYDIRIMSHKPLPIDIEVGLFSRGKKRERVDEFKLDSNRFDGWHTVAKNFKLEKGQHYLELQVSNIPSSIVEAKDTLWSIHFRPTSPLHCTFEQGVIKLLNYDQQKTKFFAPVSALYDITINTLQNHPLPMATTHSMIKIDGMPLSPKIITTDAQKTIFSPISLNKGYHMISFGKWQQLNLTPRYPSIQDITPVELNKSNKNFALLTTTSIISSGWKWYQNSPKNIFYNIQLFGSTNITFSTVNVFVDNHLIGEVTLNNYGTIPSPLLIELARGTTRTLSIQSTDLKEEAQVYLYAIQIREHEGNSVISGGSREPWEKEYNPDILVFAGSSMHWKTKYNNNITTNGSIIQLPPNTILSKKIIAVKTSGNYNITIRYRIPTKINQQITLHCEIGGWPIEQKVISTKQKWQEHTFKVYLTKDTHNFQLWWENGMGDLDIMHIILAKKSE